MAYTKTQLIDAYCTSRNYDAAKHGTKAEFIQSERARIQKGIDEFNARMSTSALREMRKVALRQLAEEAEAASPDFE